MGGNGSPRTAYLTLDRLTADLKLAGRLPPDLAWRYHALPLAEDNGRVTVAMADPDDAEAREAVVALLGSGACVVKGSPLAIDAWLAEIWGEAARRQPDYPALEVTVCDLPEPFPKELWAYAQAIGALLAARLSRVSTAEEVNGLTSERERGHCDLVILGAHSQPVARRLLSSLAADGAQRTVPFAMLVARQPRWPLARILLVICGECADGAAVDWALRLALPAAADVTVLAVVPPVPAMYSGLSRMEQSLAGLLRTDTALGRQMRHVAHRLAECRVNGTLRLRQGAPDDQIYRELVEGDHDLIVMAAKPCNWWLRQLQGDPICSLLSRIDRPLLLAEPMAA